MAFLTMRQSNATQRMAIFTCQETQRRCRCGDPACKALRPEPGCGRAHHLPERVWPDLESESSLSGCISLLDREEDEEAFAHESDPRHARR